MGFLTWLFGSRRREDEPSHRYLCARRGRGESMRKYSGRFAGEIILDMDDWCFRIMDKRTPRGRRMSPERVYRLAEHYGFYNPYDQAGFTIRLPKEKRRPFSLCAARDLNCTPPMGAVLYDTIEEAIYIGDGETPGGRRLR